MYYSNKIPTVTTIIDKAMETGVVDILLVRVHRDPIRVIFSWDKKAKTWYPEPIKIALDRYSALGYRIGFVKFQAPEEEEDY